MTENITEDTTWTESGSPYDLDATVSVKAGATLTIEPGVTVDFNAGSSAMLHVYGAIHANGTTGSPITITSSQGLSGAGEPGQYRGIGIWSEGPLSTISHTEFTYGGTGSGGYQNYGVLEVGNGAPAVIDHDTFEHNKYSGLEVWAGSTATISYSTFSNNGDGVSILGSSTAASIDHSTISNNVSSGAFFNRTPSTSAGSRFVYDTIVKNGAFGIRIQQECSDPASAFAHGEYNNIYANDGTAEAERQLYTLHKCEALPVDWRNNYWGPDVYFYHNNPACAGTEQSFLGHLAYTWSKPTYEWQIPKGPLNSNYVPHASTKPYYGCGWDTFDIGPNDFLTSPVEGAPEPPNSVFFGGESPLFAPSLWSPKCADPVNCVTGNFSETRTDLSVPGLNGGLDFSRTYNSLAALEGTESALGRGWTYEYGESLELDPSETAATITNADGSRVTFTEEEGEWTAPAWVQATLVQNEGGSFTYTLPSQRAFDFSSEGRLESIADRNGNETTLSYNEAGQLTTVTDPSERELTFAYDEAGLIESVTDPEGHEASFSYDEEGDLVSVTDPGEASEGYEYDSGHLLTAMTDPRGGETTNVYDEQGRVTAQVDPMERETTWTYNEGNTEVTLPNEAVTKIAFEDNLPTEISHAYGSEDEATTKYEYDEDLYPVARTDPDGHKTEFGYDAEGNRTSETDAAGDETTRTYNSKRQVVSITTPRGEKTTIERDADGNPISISRPAPGEATQTTSVEYDSRGLPESVTDPLERTWGFEYDSHGDRTAVTGPLGDKQTMAYDEDSRLVSVVSPRGNVEGAEASQYETAIERDAQGRPTKVTDPLGHATEYAWDAAGNLLSKTDAKGQTTKYTYNAANELTEVERPSGAVLKTAYDSLGKVVSQTDPNEHVTEYVRNLLGRPVEAIDPLERESGAEYDAAGNLTAFTDAEGRTTSYEYDAANRLTKASYSDETTADVEAAYDADSNLTSMVDGTGESTYAYDQLGRLTETEDGHGDTVGYEFDLGEQLKKITYPNGKAVTRGFDEAGRLASVTDWLENTTSFAYNPNSALTQTTFPEGTGNVDEYAYDRTGSMSEASFGKGAETLASLAYARDKLGQLESLAGAGLPGASEEAFGYDENDRLTEAGEASFEYDLAGNLTKAPGTNNTYDAASQLEAGTGLSYAYDKLGERTEATPEAGQATSYGYDQAGDLTSVERAAEGESPAIEVGYAYDGAGLIASRTSGETTHHFAWDENAGLPLLLSDGQASYVYGPQGLPVESIEGETPTYYHHDQLGSTRLLTNSSGETTGVFTYGPYGTPEGSTGTATTPLGFAGQYTDPETGLQFLRARFYDPATGQFMSRDPLEALTRSPYGYGNENPLRFVDPSGMDCSGLLPNPVDCATEVVEDVAEAGSTLAGAAGDAVEAGGDAVRAAPHFVDEHRAELVPVAAAAVCVAQVELCPIAAGFSVGFMTGENVAHELSEPACFDFTSSEVQGLLVTGASLLPGGVFETSASRISADVGLTPVAERILRGMLDGPGTALEVVHARRE